MNNEILSNREACAAHLNDLMIAYLSIKSEKSAPMPDIIENEKNIECSIPPRITSLLEKEILEERNSFQILSDRNRRLIKKNPLSFRSRRKYKFLAKIRWELWYRLRNEFGWSYLRIAKKYGYDHTTIMHGVRMHSAILSKGESNYE